MLEYNAPDLAFRQTRGMAFAVAQAASGCLTSSTSISILSSIAHEEAAGLERLVPGQAEVLAVDLRARRGRAPQVPPRILELEVRRLDREDHGPGDSVNGEVAGDGEAISRRRQLVLRNSIVGNRSASRKSALRRWASRWGSRVSMLAASMIAWMLERPSLSGSRVTDPETLSNCPRTVATTRCLIEKCTPVWAGSMFQVVVASVVAADDMAYLQGHDG